MTIRVQAEDFDTSAEIAKLRHGNPRIGAVACFIGLVRDLNEENHIYGMELEHYPGMTEKALENITSLAKQRWNIADALIIHRVGALQPTDQIVLVATSGIHRGEVFASCEFIMDYLKTQAPFWKKEQTDTGTRWVDARDSDDQAAQRWQT